MNMQDKLYQALKSFHQWFEDNFGDQSWLDVDDDTDGPDGTWKPYHEMPEYNAALDAIIEYEDS